MAKESMKAKERKRAKLAAQYDERRETLLRKAQSEGDWEAMFKLQKASKEFYGCEKTQQMSTNWKT